MDRYRVPESDAASAEQSAAQEERGGLSEQAIIGFGSNLGDRVLTCRQALELLGRHPQVSLQRVSSLYRSEPVGFTDQDWFINGVVICQVDVTPEALLGITLEVEQSLGRIRKKRWGPRTLDLDILFFGRHCLSLPGLTIPHPRLHERRFVLVPLVEIAPDWIHPVLNLSMEELLSRLAPEGQDVLPWEQP
jgi:2-amino-4-hydroxy-6-hydroxymethyldihydropteridine diphosphokinase